MNIRRRSRGFTLVEVLVALTIAGLLALLAHRLVSAATNASHALVTARREADRRANGRRWLSSALLSLEAGGAAGGFEGHAGSMRFGARLQQPQGWFSLERVELRQDGSRLLAQPVGSAPIVLRERLQRVEFDYLLEPGLNTRWVREWISPLSAPLAVRLRLYRVGGDESPAADTLLFLIKERG